MSQALPPQATVPAAASAVNPNAASRPYNGHDIEEFYRSMSEYLRRLPADDPSWGTPIAWSTDPSRRPSPGQVAEFRARPFPIPSSDRILIVLDLGHGAKILYNGVQVSRDHGTGSADVNEFKVANAVGKQLEGILAGTPNVDILFTRKPGEEILDNRGVRPGSGHQSEFLGWRGAVVDRAIKELGYNPKNVIVVSLHHEGTGPAGVLYQPGSEHSKALAHDIENAGLGLPVRNENLRLSRQAPEGAAVVTLELGNRDSTARLRRGMEDPAIFAKPIADGVMRFIQNFRTSPRPDVSNSPAQEVLSQSPNGQSPLPNTVIYNITTGAITKGDTGELVALAGSGRGSSHNNPLDIHKFNSGPIPPGKYDIAPMSYNGVLKQNSLVLTPNKETDISGRDPSKGRFNFHVAGGDLNSGGCVVVKLEADLKRIARLQQQGYTTLEVITGGPSPILQAGATPTAAGKSPDPKKIPEIPPSAPAPDGATPVPPAGRSLRLRPDVKQKLTPQLPDPSAPPGVPSTSAAPSVSAPTAPVAAGTPSLAALTEAIKKGGNNNAKAMKEIQKELMRSGARLIGNDDGKFGGSTQGELAVYVEKAGGASSLVSAISQVAIAKLPQKASWAKQNFEALTVLNEGLGLPPPAPFVAAADGHKPHSGTAHHGQWRKRRDPLRHAPSPSAP